MTVPDPRQLSTSAAPGRPAEDADVLSLHEALAEFASVNARQADVIELRYFGGLTLEEIAAVTSRSVATVKRDLDEATQWLRHRWQSGS